MTELYLTLSVTLLQFGRIFLPYSSSCLENKKNNKKIVSTTYRFRSRDMVRPARRTLRSEGVNK